jgi:hypothetical protein
MKRFKVATCEGYPFTFNQQGGPSRLGLTASVLDTLRAHREVKRFRTESLSTNIVGPVHRRRETLRQARDYADKLNAECGRT